MRARFAGAKIEFLLVTNPLDVAYLTGFLGGDSYLVVPKGDSKPTLVSDFRYLEELEHFKELCTIVIRKGAMGKAIVELLSKCKGSVGFQSECMTVSEATTLDAALEKSKAVFTPTIGLVGSLRAVKDASEIALIKAAVKIQEKSLMAILKKATPGKTEQELAGKLEAEMKSRGSREASFHSIVGAGANSSLPHYRPGAAKVKKNDVLLIDWGAVVDGYHSDMTRTFALGKWPKKVKEIYKVVLEAHELAAAALAPGKLTSEIDGIARGHIAKAGFGEYFGHGLGHGIGLNVHEEPRLSHMASGTELVPGHVVTIEPGIYLPGIGGVRLENDYAVTDKGRENLCSLPMDLDWATL